MNLTFAPSAIPFNFSLSFADINPSLDDVATPYVVSLEEIVILSFVASGVIVTFDPATSVNVSVAESAETVVEPMVTLLNAFWLTYALWV